MPLLHSIGKSSSWSHAPPHPAVRVGRDCPLNEHIGGGKRNSMDDVLRVHLNGFLDTTVALIDLDAELVVAQVVQDCLGV